MLLLLTNSIDGTSDEIVRRVGSDRVFRFNIDLWRDYTFEVSTDGFHIADPFGRTIRSSDVAACYLRKPTFDDPIEVPGGGSLEAWLRSQVTYICREIYSICQRDGKVRLVEKGAEQRFGKVLQMQLASRYFRVPKWRILKSQKPPAFCIPLVAKALAADFVENYRVFYTTPVVPEKIDLSFPWFLQEQVEAELDLTVVYVAKRCFAFSLERKSFPGIDWRKQINKAEMPWQPHTLSASLNEQICQFMEAASLRFGRLDFLATGDKVDFLEVNPNGQWAWLDMEGKNGVFDAVVEELTCNWGG